jgi:hypothetical protein
MTIDFSLKRAQKMGGLTIGLAPGEYKRYVSSIENVYLSEKAFFFFEPAIRRRSAKYARPFAHWGTTPIPKGEWLMIIEDWKRVSAELAGARSIDSVSEFAQMSRELRKEFDDSFTANKSGLMAALFELGKWLEQMLERSTVVSVLGV